MFQFQQFNFLGVQDPNGSSQGFGIDDASGRLKKQNNSFGVSAFNYNQEQQNYNSADEQGVFFSNYHHHQQEQQLRRYPDDDRFDDGYFDTISPEEIQELVSSEILDLNEPKRESSVTGSLKILRNYPNKFGKILDAERNQVQSHFKEFTTISSQKLSVNEIIKFAAEHFIQGSSKDGAESSVLNHPYPNSFTGMRTEDIKGFLLVQYLLASAEKVGQGQFDRARNFVLQCDDMSSDKGNPIERLVYYFSGALHERIDRQTGTVTPKGLGKKPSLKIKESMMKLSPEKAAMQKYAPFSQVCHFSGTQAILDHVAEASKVHIIDLDIRSGMQHTILMHALATRRQGSPEYLKITAIGTKSKAILEETGRQLSSFAQSLNLKFSFHIVMVADVMELHENLFEVNTDEAVAVYTAYFMLYLIGHQDRLQHLMTVIKTIKPHIFVMTEVQGNQNSPNFVSRFVESLFYYGAFFDCLEDCLKHDEANRVLTESEYFGQGIRTVVAAEGQDRTIRHVTMKIWRAFFAQFKMVEEELSMSSMFQAKSVLQNFACGNSCTLDLDGKSLIVGWKGTPLISLSAWKFR